MITVIFSTKEHNEPFIKHIKKTIGLPVGEYEIIETINNSNPNSTWFNGGESLTKVYKRGLNESKNDIVMFTHDDIKITTKNWGRKVLSNFSNNDFGILGFAGTKSLDISGIWWKDKPNLVGKVSHTNKGKTYLSKFSNDTGDSIIETLLVDGLCFFVDKRKVTYEFDPNVEGFHFYDVDYTFGNHINGTKVGVMVNIDITHQSIGEVNKEWEINRKKFVRKYLTHIPKIIE